MTQDVIVGITITVSLVVIFYFLYTSGKAIEEIENSVSPRERREIRIKELIDKIQLALSTNTRGKEIKVLYEELSKLKKEHDSEKTDIMGSADQKEKLILELKNESENLKKEIENQKESGIENDKLLEIVAEQKKTILYLEMELKIKKSADEKLVY